MADLVGTKLGGYEVLSSLGAGGMGEVYRARDPKLGRDVALKVLPKDVAAEADRLRRFEQEARAASALNHPNIVTIYDVGTLDSTAYIAMEYVEGKTLRSVIAGAPLPTRRLLEVAAQIADGLSKAHSAGIVHRDLKPENVMVTKDGFVKILDFGLAKLTQVETSEGSRLTTLTELTTPGTVVGTVGYMSPEQASGQAVDFRSDQFALGSILHEMATGRQAFRRATAAQTMAAIIQEEPEVLASASPKSPAPLRWIVERCLSKDPDRRYASTRDLARDLAMVRDHLSETSSTVELAVPPSPRALMRRVALAAAFAVSIAAAAIVTRRLSEKPTPAFRRLTFRRGYVGSARFAPDGRSILYSAAWDGAPLKAYVKQPESPESVALELPSANVLGVSLTGELALALDCKLTHFGVCSGTLARAPLVGGAPREVEENVQEAEWTPEGSLAIVRDLKPTGARLELPPGKILYETKQGHVSYARVSPRGDRIAFFDHPGWGSDDGAVAVVERSGRKRALTKRFDSVRGLAWAGAEIWFTASEGGPTRALYAVTLSGRLRIVHRSPVALTLFDVSRDGRALLAREEERTGLLGAGPGEHVERDLSWLDLSTAEDLSSDGRLLLVSDESEGFGGFGGRRAWGLRKMDGSSVVRLGELGDAASLSDDGNRLLTIRVGEKVALSIVPLGPGESRPVDVPGIEVGLAAWWPDGRILILGREPGRPRRAFLFDPATRERRAITPEGVPPEGSNPFFEALTPIQGGRYFLARRGDGGFALYPVAGGEPVAVALRLEPGEYIYARPAADGRSVYVSGWSQLPLRVFRVDVETGARTLWKELAPAERAGVSYVRDYVLTSDGSAYVYKYRRRLSDLFLVEGLR
jgi:serine/threonine protein kinase